MDSVNVQQTSDDVRSYEFDSDIGQRDLNWLRSNRHVKSYEVSGKTLTITADTSDWATLESDFIMPGLGKTFGSQLKVNDYTSANA